MCVYILRALSIWCICIYNYIYIYTYTVCTYVLFAFRILLQHAIAGFLDIFWYQDWAEVVVVSMSKEFAFFLSTVPSVWSKGTPQAKSSGTGILRFKMERQKVKWESCGFNPPNPNLQIISEQNWNRTSYFSQEQHFDVKLLCSHVSCDSTERLVASTTCNLNWENDPFVVEEPAKTQKKDEKNVFVFCSTTGTILKPIDAPWPRIAPKYLAWSVKPAATGSKVAAVAFDQSYLAGAVETWIKI